MSDFRLGTPDFGIGTFNLRLARDWLRPFGGCLWSFGHRLRLTFDSFKTLFCRLHRIVACVYGLNRPFPALLVAITTTMTSIPALISSFPATIV
jgi:hypothetical protein